MKLEQMIISFIMGYAAGNLLISLYNLYQDYRYKKQLEENRSAYRALVKRIEEMAGYSEEEDRK